MRYNESKTRATYLCHGFIPEGVYRDTALGSLTLTGHLEILPDTIASLKNLTSLKSENCKLRYLPDALEARPNLRELSLSNNELSSIPPSLGNLTQLQQLDLSDNQISQFPEWLCRLTNLKALNFSNNHLASLPETIGRLGNLTRFDLHGNWLTTLPESIRFLSALNWLDLGSNRLTKLPDGLGRLVLGQLLLASNADLTAFPEGVITQFLDISGCARLETLPESVTVRILELANAGLRRLPDKLVNSQLSLLWRGLPVPYRFICEPETLTVDELLGLRNLELRRMLLQRIGMEAFIDKANPAIIAADSDPGGSRRLLKIDLPFDEPLTMLDVHCPSTGRRYFLRVPPMMQTCHQAAAWIAGFTYAQDYAPIQET